MENFANPTPVQITLREMHRIFSSPRFWIGFVVVVGMLTVMGPFGTLGKMAFARRLVYWGSISLLTFPIGLALSIYLSVLLERFSLPTMLARLIAGAVAGFPIAMAVMLVDLIDNGGARLSVTNLIRFSGYTVPIAAGLSLIAYLLQTTLEKTSSPGNIGARKADRVKRHPATAAFGGVQFLQRLPVELGKDLISLQAQDHYVRAETARGSEMVLIRLADAERELQGLPGLRVHRSWWVADAHLDHIERRDGKPFLVLSNGKAIPVSRTYLGEVRSHMANRQD